MQEMNGMDIQRKKGTKTFKNNYEIPTHSIYGYQRYQMVKTFLSYLATFGSMLLSIFWHYVVQLLNSLRSSTNFDF